MNQQNTEPLILKCEGCGYQTMIWPEESLDLCPKCSCVMIQITELKLVRERNNE